jgi:hypothetical protein
MRKFSLLFKPRGNQRGVTILLVAIVMVVLIGFAALAIDIGHLFVVRNELQNAADAGALAGARVLYNDAGTSVNTGANQVAKDAATANFSEKLAVEVKWPSDNDVERGHWSFGLGSLARGFYANETVTDPPALWDVTTVQLDQDTDFINAVRVKTRRESMPAASFFGRIFGYDSFILNTEAVAYRGFAGQLEKYEVDQPIAICLQAITDPATGAYSCNVGRMINSSGSTATGNTGGWTNFTQNPCSTASNSTVKPLVCGEGNLGTLFTETDMGTVGGMQQDVFDKLMGCWQEWAGLPNNPNSNDPSAFPTKPWTLTLPVIDCEAYPGNVQPCSKLKTAVELNVIWITRTGWKNPKFPLPNSMAGVNDVTAWTPPLENIPANAEANWNDFVQHFKLVGTDGTPVTAEDKTIYVLPDCSEHAPVGGPSGINTGILSKYPAIVK